MLIPGVTLIRIRPGRVPISRFAHLLLISSLQLSTPSDPTDLPGSAEQGWVPWWSARRTGALRSHPLGALFSEVPGKFICGISEWIWGGDHFSGNLPTYPFCHPMLLDVSDVF